MKRFAPLFLAALTLIFMACSVEQADLPSRLTEDLNVQEIQELSLTPLSSEYPDEEGFCDDYGVVISPGIRDGRTSVIPMIEVKSGKFAGELVRPVNFIDFSVELAPDMEIGFNVVAIDNGKTLYRFRKGIAVKLTCLNQDIPR